MLGQVGEDVNIYVVSEQILKPYLINEHMAAKITCPNCNALTPVIPPNYRCKACDYPLKKTIRESENPELIMPDEININLGGFISSGGVSSEDPTEINVRVNDDDHRVEEVDEQGLPIVNVNIGFDNQVVQEEAPGGDDSKPVTNESLAKDRLIAAWLVVHTEEKEPETFELYLGDNFFGTPAEGYQVEIPIKNDRYVSRSHANLKVTKDFLHRFQYVLYDNGERRDGAKSTNGTFLNGLEDRLPPDQKVYLQDGDTIQVGLTKMVFKTVKEVDDELHAKTSVVDLDYTKTVILDR